MCYTYAPFHIFHILIIFFLLFPLFPTPSIPMKNICKMKKGPIFHVNVCVSSIHNVQDIQLEMLQISIPISCVGGLTHYTSPPESRSFFFVCGCDGTYVCKFYYRISGRCANHIHNSGDENWISIYKNFFFLFLMFRLEYLKVLR